MLRIRIAQLAFFFIFAAVTKVDAVMTFAGNFANLHETAAVTIPATSQSALEFFNAASDILNAPLSWHTGAILGDNWNVTEPTGMPVAQLPEPASVILLGIGILVVAFFCRRGLRKR